MCRYIFRKSHVLYSFRTYAYEESVRVCKVSADSGRILSDRQKAINLTSIHTQTEDLKSVTISTKFCLCYL